MRKGFTLIELLLVIAIIAILAGAMVPLLRGSRTEAKNARALADVDAAKTASMMYRSDTNEWPAALDDLVSAPGGVSNWDGPYIDTIGKDPWKHEYVIAIHNTTTTYIQSLGADGEEDNCDFTDGTNVDDLCVVLHQ